MNEYREEFRATSEAATETLQGRYDYLARQTPSNFRTAEMRSLFFALRTMRMDLLRREHQWRKQDILANKPLNESSSDDGNKQAD